MRLALILLRQNKPNGHIYRGKHKLIKKVSEAAANTLRKQYEIEEQNMLLLRYPYLSQEQSHGHAKALGKEEALRLKWAEEKLKFKENVTLMDRLSHLKVKDAWE